MINPLNDVITINEGLAKRRNKHLSLIIPDINLSKEKLKPLKHKNKLEKEILNPLNPVNPLNTVNTIKPVNTVNPLLVKPKNILPPKLPSPKNSNMFTIKPIKKEFKQIKINQNVQIT